MFLRLKLAIGATVASMRGFGARIVGTIPARSSIPCFFELLVFTVRTHVRSNNGFWECPFSAEDNLMRQLYFLLRFS